MSQTEHERLELYELAKQGVGERFAALMMQALPPEPDELLRRADLTRSEERIEQRIALASAELRTEMRDSTTSQTRTLMLGLVGSVTALAVTEIALTTLA